MQAKRFTIVGDPVLWSISPELFRAAYPMHPEMQYDRKTVKSAEEALKVLRSGYSGGNVTAPYKIEMLNMVDEVSEDALAIGAINTVLISPAGLISAANTDYIGVSRSFDEHNILTRNRSCLILGAGGAGRAAAYALNLSGADLTIANRTEDKAREFAEKISCKSVGTTQSAEFEKIVRESEIIVNTLYPSVDIIDSEWLNEKQVILDASYLGSTLTKKAKMRGCYIIDGRYWVFYQALHCYVMFSGIRPDEQAMRRFVGI